MRKVYKRLLSYFQFSHRHNIALFMVMIADYTQIECYVAQLHYARYNKMSSLIVFPAREAGVVQKQIQQQNKLFKWPGAVRRGVSVP